MKKNILVLSSLSLFLLTGCDDDDRREVDLIMQGQYTLEYFDKYGCSNSVVITNNLSKLPTTAPTIHKEVGVSRSSADVDINDSKVNISAILNYTYDNNADTVITQESCKTEIKNQENSTINFSFDLSQLTRVNDEHVYINDVPGTLKINSSTGKQSNVKGKITFKERFDDLESLEIIINDEQNNYLGKMRLNKTGW